MADIKAIFWDFDGVLLNSNDIRDKGFSDVLKDYPYEEVERLLEFHRQNGGLSRYVKFRYFFERIRGETITDDEVRRWAGQFSHNMKDLLKDPMLQIPETINYVKRNHTKIVMYVVSGSDQDELRFLCRVHGISECFKRIHGSPTPKKEWVATILKEENLSPTNCVLVGDSINDYEAAQYNQVGFMSYNNKALNKYSTYKIEELC